MPYEEKCEPQREPVYYSLINQCEDIISSINTKTSFIQNQRPPKASAKEVECGSPLEERLKVLVNRLEDLNDSYKL